MRILKKQVLSVLLAFCLVVEPAVPAMAADGISVPESVPAESIYQEADEALLSESETSAVSDATIESEPDQPAAGAEEETDTEEASLPESETETAEKAIETETPAEEAPVPDVQEEAARPEGKEEVDLSDQDIDLSGLPTPYGDSAVVYTPSGIDEQDPEYLRLLEEGTLEEYLDPDSTGTVQVPASGRKLTARRTPTTVESATTSPFTGTVFTHQDTYATNAYKIVNGIDVSKWQGTIDWSAVREAGVEFAIIRAGYRRLETGELVVDEQFETNAQGAIEAGIPHVGFYFFSQPVNKAEVIEEAQMLIDLTKDYDFDFPLVYDLEISDGSTTSRSVAAGITPEDEISYTCAFIEYLRDKGCFAMDYTSAYRLGKKYKGGQEFLDMDIPIWLAHYTDSSKSTYENFYTGPIEIWQYSSSGTVPGISTRCDVDFWYQTQPFSLEYSGRTTYEVGEVIDLVPEVLPEKAWDRSVTYATDDASVVSISTDGTLKAAAEGTAHITGSTINGLEETVEITVVPEGQGALNTVSGLKVTSSPSDCTVDADTLQKFPVTVNQDENISYQWEVSEDGGKTWRDFSEKKTSLKAELYFTVTEAMHTWQFRCRVTNGTETVYSDPFTVRITGKDDTPVSGKTYQITFNKNASDATGTMSSQTAQVGAQTTLSANAFKRSGYTFAGWTTSAAKQNPNLLGGTYSLTSLSDNSSVSAVWTYGGDSWSNKSNVAVVKAENPPTQMENAVSLTAKNGSQIEFAQYDTAIADATEYTASAYIKGSGTFRIEQGGSGRYSDSKYKSQTFTVNSLAWKRVSFTFTTTSGMTHNGRGAIFFGNIGDSGTIQVTGMKLERGTEATAWNDLSANIGIIRDGAAVKDLAAEGKTATLYAQWTDSSSAAPSASEYVIHYYPNDTSATGTMADQVVGIGKSVALNKNQFAVSGKGFQYWSTQPYRANLIPGTGNITSLSNDSSCSGIWTYTSEGWSNKDKISIVSVSDAPVNVKKSIKLVANNTEVGVGVYDLPMKKNTTYTLSCYARGSGSFDLQEGGGGRYEDSDYTWKSYTITSSWKLLTYTFYTSGNLTQNGLGSLYFLNTGKTGTIEICGMKLEEGNSATAWTAETSGIKTYEDGATVKDLTTTGGGEVSLYAIWESGEYTIAYDAMGGTGSMDDKSVSIGDTVDLDYCRYIKNGYVFRGWNTKSDGSGTHYGDGVRVKNLTTKAGSTVTLYAEWEVMSYLVHFLGNGATSGTMADQFIARDTSKALTKNAFKKTGSSFANWLYGSKTYNDGASVKNLISTTGTGTMVASVTGGTPKNSSYPYKDAQGCAVYKHNGTTFAVFAISNVDSAYYAGDLSHYDTVLVKYNLDTGKVVARKQGLAFDHGNGICYNPDTGYLYIAECGMRSEYPAGIMVVDQNLNFVKEITSSQIGTDVVGIAYNDHKYYITGGFSGSYALGYTLDENFKIIDEYKLYLYEDAYTLQSLTADDKYLYVLGASFSVYSYKRVQRINVYDHSGNFITTWYTDITTDELEDMDFVDGQAYLSTQYSNKGRLFKVDLPVVEMKASWSGSASSTNLAVTTQPVGATVDPDTLTAFTVEVNKPDGASYQWQVSEDNGKTWRDFTEKQTAKTKKLNFTITAAMNNWQLRCVVKNGSETVTSSAVMIKVNLPLVFTEYPSGDATVEAGEMAKWIAHTDPEDGTSYQWQVSEDNGNTWRDFTEKQTAKTYRLWFTVTEAMHNWQFRCVATNGENTITGKAFRLTVTKGGTPIPDTDYTALTITSQPSDMTAPLGEQLRFKVVPNKTAGTTYQWQVSEDGGKTYRNFTEKLTSVKQTLLCTVEEKMDGWRYRCIVTNGTETVTTTPVKLTLKKTLVITQQPSDVSIELGKQASFLIKTDRKVGTTYQWQVSEDGGKTWRDYTEKQTSVKAQLNATVTEGMEDWQVRCIVTNGSKKLTSNAATIHVTTKLAITSSPKDAAYKAGTQYKFLVVPNYLKNNTYQWQVSTDGGKTWRNFTEKQTAVKRQLSCTMLKSMNGWQLRCIVTHTSSTGTQKATSPAAKITVS